MWKKTAIECNRRFGDNFKYDSLEDCPSWGVLEEQSHAGKDAYKIWLEPGFFRDVEAFPGAIEVLSLVHEQGHKIVIVTSSHPKTIQDKQDWFLEHFPFLTYKDIIISHQKELIHGDIFVDDNAKLNLMPWKEAHPNGLAIAMAAGYNRDWQGPRMKDWYDFPKILDEFNNQQFGWNDMKQIVTKRTNND